MSLNSEKNTPNNNNNNFEINKMRIDANNTELLSQITKIFYNNYTNTDNKLDINILNNNESKKSSIYNGNNDFINETGLKISNLLNINCNSKENIGNDEIPINYNENTKKLNSTKGFVEKNENSYEKCSYIQKNDVIKLKLFNKEIYNKFKNDNNIQDDINFENTFDISSIDIERNIFSYNTYSEKYISEEEYASDTSSEYYSTSPFKYDNVIGINIPYDASHDEFNKIASPQPESIYNIGSAIESFNEIADYIYENGKNKDINKPDFYNSGKNNSIKKNDTFIKNYFDQTKYSDKSKFYYPKNDYHRITFKSLSNKKINSNDVIDRGYLCNIEYDKTNEKKIKYINEISEINNKMERNKKNRNPNEYTIKESLENTTDDNEVENIYINEENYYYNNNTCDLKLNNGIYI